jgi:signal peptidase
MKGGQRMPTNKKQLYAVSVVTLLVLLIVLFAPVSSRRIQASLLLLPLAAGTWFLVRKTTIPSLYHKQILLLMTTIGVVYLVLFYLTGLKFGFVNNMHRVGISNLFKFVLPITAIVVATEFIRSRILAQNSRLANFLCYSSCVIAELLIAGSLNGLGNFNKFMDFLGILLIPALVSHALYQYLSRRYGMYPNIVYRLLITLYAYAIPIVPATPSPLLAFANLLVPIAIYSFIDLLYEKKIRYALGKKTRLGAVVSVLVIVVLTLYVMLISNQFRYGALVIATDSMTGELNRGDVTVFERYEDHLITEGQVIIFEKDGSMVVHRVVEIQNINGETRYFTQGDMNKDPDAGYITNSNIVGIAGVKIPYIGYPTLWIRNLFSR